MASYATELPLDHLPADVWAACEAAVKAGGWKVREAANPRIVCRETWSLGLFMSSHPAKIEIALYSAQGGSLVRVRASNFGIGPIASLHVRLQAERLVELLKFALADGAAAGAPAPLVGGTAIGASAGSSSPVAVAKPVGFREILAHKELTKLTQDWTTPVLIRQYDPGAKGLKKANMESNLLAARGYRVAAQTDVDGHVNLGRLALTGGLGLLFGGTRSKGRVTITFEKASAG